MKAYQQSSIRKLETILASARMGYGKLCAKLGYTFVNIKLLTEALTKVGAITEQVPGHAMQSYQRKEHLGDGVLNLALIKLLYDTFTNATESELHDKKVWLEQNKIILPQIGKDLALDKYLIMGRGEKL